MAVGVQRVVGTVDIVDDTLFVGQALRAVARVDSAGFRVKRVERSWIGYITRQDLADVVIVRDGLNDHVPTLLKVRALHRAETVPIVIGDRPRPAQVSRLRGAGAQRVFTQDDSLDDVIAFLRSHVADRAAMPLPWDAVVLSDHELQVACLYVGRGAPSARLLSQLLGMPYASTRTYLQRARKALSVTGETRTRLQLRQRLVEGGWL
jgi:hypothetical protein